MELILFFLTIPFFYVWGIISFIKSVSKPRPSNPEAKITDRKSFLLTTISELRTSLEKKPEQKVRDLLQTYEEELKTYSEFTTQSVQTSIEQEKEGSTSVKISSGEPKVTIHSSPTFQNWYKDNSINLLLYIGAFLIVVSAAIYVGLEGASGISKGFLLSLLTLLFFAAGLSFYRMPKIKNAGSAFAAIGSLLIPITGMGWYNFVFKGTDISMGVVWLVTSIIGLFAYIVLAKYFKSAFYSYVASFSTLSFSLAFINAQGLHDEFYILASIMSSILLLGVSIYFNKNKNEDRELFAQPFNITANIIMPVSLLYGLQLSSENTLFTMQSTLSVLLGCVYYLICYLYFKRSWYILAAQLLFVVGLVYFGNWQELSVLQILYMITASTYLDIYLLSHFNKHSLKDETLMMTYLSLGKSTLLFLYAVSIGLNPEQLLFFASIPIIVGLFLVVLLNNIYFAGFSILFLSIAFYILVQNVLNFSDKPYVLGLLYALCGIASYFASLKYKNQQHVLQVFGLASGAYFVLSTIFIGSNWTYQVANSIAIAIIAYGASITFSNMRFQFVVSTFVAFAIWCLSKMLALEDMSFITGTVYALFGGIWYAAAVLNKKRSDLVAPFTYAVIINFFLSLLIFFTSEFTLYQVLVCVTISAVFYSASAEFSKKDFIVYSNSFLAISVWSLLRFIHADFELYPLAFTTLAYMFYLFNVMTQHAYKDIYRQSGLLGTLATTVLYGMQAYGNQYGYSPDLNLERNTLMASYATLILYSFDAYAHNSSKQGYRASVIGLITYLWQIHFLGFTETQYYTLAIGVYFFVLSYLQRKAKNSANKQLFDFIGTGFLLVPTWVQSFGENGVFYAFLLGLIGVSLLAFAITYTDRWYRYAGIAAIVLAVTSQSTWTVIGIAGIGFLGLALYLLIFRKDEEHKSK